VRPPFIVGMAWRESRGSRRRLALYLGAVSLGVAALVAINSFSANVTASIHAQARTLLGADLELRSRSPFPSAVDSLLDSLQRAGAPVARLTSFASMVLAPRTGRTRLFDVRAVEPGFPFYGTITTDPPGQWSAFQGAPRVVVDPAVLVHLDAHVGDTVYVGEAHFTIAGVITNSPGDVGLRTALGPRVFLPARYLGETRLLQFGSRASYRALLEQPDEAAVQRLLNRHNALLERGGIRSETVTSQEEDLTRALGRLARYLGLVGLIALLLGGLGVGSAVRVFVRDKLDDAAVLRCLGARQRTVLLIYLLQAVVIGLLGSAAGVLLGLLVQAALPSVVGEFLPVAVAVTPHWSSVLAGLGIGIGTAVLFAALPLLSLQEVTPLRALRREVDVGAAPRVGRVWRLVVWGLMLAALVGLSLWQAPRRATGFWFAAGVLLATVVLWLTAHALMWSTRRFFPRRASYVVRQGIANLFRPHNQTAAVVLAIGFGVFLIATLYVVQQNLLDQFALDADPHRPNLVFFDVQVDQRAGVARLLDARGLTPLETAPIVPARIAAVNGQPVDSLTSGSSGRRRGGRGGRWALQREYRNTYRDSLVASEQLVAGTWWDGPRSPGALPRISVEADVAAEAGLQLGDRVTWNVQGVSVETRIASLRQVQWARFEPNFFVVFEPGVLERAPQTDVILVRAPDPSQRAELQRDVVLAYPNVSALDLAQVQQTLDGVLTKVTLAIRFMALFSIACGFVILIGALAASRLQRLREVILLKTLGATARQVRHILLTEYAAWGSLAALTGVMLAGAAGWGLVTRFFDIPFRLPVERLAVVWIGVCAVTIAVGLLNSRALLRGTPLGAWRSLGE
jgi:putative ABC transport system permease protein